MAGFELTPEELKLFLEESTEQLQLMEENLISLEENPTSAHVVQEIFRAAHTLKGGAATAGFENVARLTHAMESLLDLVRQGETRLSSELADRLLEGVDVLRQALAAVAQHGTADGIDVTSAIELLGHEVEMNLPTELGGERPPIIGVTVTISPDAMMPSVRAYQVLLAIEDHASVLETRPPRDVIEGNEVSVQELAATIILHGAFETLEERIRRIPDVLSVERALAPGSGDDRRSGDCSERSEPGEGAIPTEPVERPGGGSDLGHTIRVDVRLLDTLMNLVGELVIDRTRLAQLATVNLDRQELQEELSEVSGRLSRITTDLQDTIMHARMMPVDMLFKKFPRMIRDLSRQLGKSINFEMTGKETELDRSVIEQIGDPLMHLLRNAVDHGIEAVEERRRMGKSDEGNLKLSAYHQENHIYIQVADDGRGLDPEFLIRKAVDKGLIPKDEAERLSPGDAIEMIFAPGFSTTSRVSAVSGRGVGMDVVKRNIEKVNGSISVETQKGMGTTFTIKLPLTLAILQALMVEIVGHVFAVPLANVTEALHVSPSDVHRARGWELIPVRGEMVPLLNPDAVWGDAWRVGQAGRPSFPVVVLSSGASPIGLKVDRLLGEQEIVIKTMGAIIGDVAGVSGASILGDGRVALIIDPTSLSNAVKALART